MTAHAVKRKQDPIQYIQYLDDTRDVRKSIGTYRNMTSWPISCNMALTVCTYTVSQQFPHHSQRMCYIVSYCTVIASSLPWITLPEIGFPKRKFIFQPPFFRCYVSFREGVSWIIFVNLIQTYPTTCFTMHLSRFRLSSRSIVCTSPGSSWNQKQLFSSKYTPGYRTWLSLENHLICHLSFQEGIYIIYIYMYKWGALIPLQKNKGNQKWEHDDRVTEARTSIHPIYQWFFKGQLGVPLTVYPWYLLCSLGILGDYNL